MVFHLKKNVLVSVLPEVLVELLNVSTSLQKYIHKSVALFCQIWTHSAIIFREPERTHNSYWIQKRSFRWCLLYPLSNDESVPSVFICDGSATFSRNKMSRSCCTQLRNWKYKLYKNSSQGCKNVSWFFMDEFHSI